MASRSVSWCFRKVLAASLVCVAVGVTSLYAQFATGTVTGTVKDQSGAVIPGAAVTLTNAGTNLKFTKTTNASGGYVFSPVGIGEYAVSAVARGFAVSVESNVSVHINQTVVVDLTLKPGAVTQTVEVTAAPPPLQTESASVGQVVSGREVNDLPLNGRNFTFLAQLAAGVNTPEADTRGNAASGAFSANGLRPGQNNYLLNGIDNNNNAVDFLNGTNFVVLPPPDAIAEFKVQTDDYSAQYGRAGAAILNATIKSGTNALHGDAYEFFRNDKLDAADFFEDAAGIPNNKAEYRHNQFGGTIGGPIRKDKIFFFGDTEILRRRQGSVFLTSVPTQLERNSAYTNLSDLISGQSGPNSTDLLGRTFPYGAIFDPATTRPVTSGRADPTTGMVATGTGYVRDPFSTCPITTANYTGGNIAACSLNMLPSSRIDPNAVKILNLFPLPTTGSLFSNYEDAPVLKENREAFDIRVDFNVNSSNQIFTVFSYVNDPQFIPGPFAGIADGGAFQDGSQTAATILPAVSWTHTFSPTMINSVRVGVNRIGTSREGPVSTQMGIPAKYGINDIPQVTLNGGLPAFGINGLSTLGSNSFLPSDEISQTNQLTDDLTKIYGKHTFKLGFEFQRVKFSTLQPPWSHGQFNFDGNYTRIPGQSSDNAGRAQFLLMPESSCPANVSNCVPNIGGSDGVFASNIANTDNGRNYYGTYFEDDWKVSPKLTMNLGLRWEYFGQTFEHFGAQANFIPGPPGSAEYLIPANRKNDVLSASFVQLTAQDGIATKYTSNQGLGVSQNTNFAPRVGFAYRLTPKLVMRGGFGIFYNGFENRGYSPNLGENYPFQFNFSYFNPNDQTPINSTVASTFAGTPCANNYPFEAGFSCVSLVPATVGASGLALRGIQYDYQTPYMEGWNYTFEYAISPSLTATAAYVGNASHHQEVFPNSNNPEAIVNVSTSPAYPYPDFGHGSSYAATEGNSYYNGLQTSLEKRYAGGLDFLAAYTWSHARTDARGPLNFGSTLVGYRAPTLAGFGIQGDYGNAPQDIRNVFHVSGTYDLPVGSGRHWLGSASGAEQRVLGGWTMNWIATLEGGQFITVGCPDGTNNSFGCNALMVPGQSLHGTKGPDGFLNPSAFTQPCILTASGLSPGSLPGCVPETGLGLLGGAGGQVSGPGIATFDFSLFKDIQLTERYRMQFRGEFFNILNHPTFNAPGFGGNGVVAIPGSLDYTNSNFGKIGSTRFPFNDPRQIQFALKLYF